MTRRQGGTNVVAIALALVVLGGLLPGTVAAQSVSETGGTVIVEEGETVDELEAFAGTVVIEGTVTGDVSAVAGDVRIVGEVGGDFEGAGGSISIDGAVDGDVDAAAGSVQIAEDATVGGDLSAGAGSVAIDGSVEGDATVGAESILLGDEAAIAGDLRYDGDLSGNTDAVGGEIQQDSSLGISTDVLPTIEPIASWMFAAYVLALNLLLGAALLALFPRFSDGVADRVSSAPARTGLLGLGVLVGVPILLIGTAITVVGIPLAIVGAFAFALIVWIGIVYGRFAVAAWVLRAVDVENRWLALVLGLVGGAVLSQVPYLGPLLNLVIFLLGLGALAWGLYSHRRTARQREREPRRGMGAEEPPVD